MPSLVVLADIIIVVLVVLLSGFATTSDAASIISLPGGTFEMGDESADAYEADMEGTWQWRGVVVVVHDQ